MPRLMNTRTEVVVRVSEAKAERMGSEWAPAEPSKPTSKSSNRKSSTKK